MILDSMPQHARPGENLRFIGFWASTFQPDLPIPWDYLDPTWDRSERTRVVQYLRSAPKVQWWRGYSDCRFCGARNGTTDRSDGTFLWPDGFAHYLERHGVRPPEEFLEHVRRALGGGA